MNDENATTLKLPTDIVNSIVRDRLNAEAVDDFDEGEPKDFHAFLSLLTRVKEHIQKEVGKK